MAASVTDDGIVLAARDVVKDFTTGRATVRALDGVTLEVTRGHFLSIMGPSGSGKSTLLHLLGGLDKPTEGEVYLEGTAVSSLPDRALTLARRHKIGFVFQFFNLVPVLSVAENVALPLVIDGKRPHEYRERIEHVLDLVGLTEWRTHLPTEVSGGQQQRVAIARALVTEPAVVLADEPTGNLDSRTGSEIMGLLKDAQRELGQTVVVVTHDAHVAAFGDEVILLRDGLITEQLVIDDVLRRRRKKPTGDERALAVLDWLKAAEA